MTTTIRPALVAPGRIFYNRDTLLAFTWGLAEATIFFIVPEVLLSRVAMLRGGKNALRACVWALAGSIIGATVIYYAASIGHGPGLLRLMDWLPGITPDLIDQAHDGLEDHGISAVFAGAFTGIPFKLYATHAGSMHVGWFLFLLASAVVRFVRFSVTSLLAWFIATKLLHSLPRSRLQLLHVAFWTVFYAVYFTRHGT